jgi:hypothetical protein
VSSLTQMRSWIWSLPGGDGHEEFEARDEGAAAGDKEVVVVVIVVVVGPVHLRGGEGGRWG